MSQEEHTFEPVYNEHSEILILGTFPSVKSREQGFYYGHPQNRFWKIMQILTHSKEAVNNIKDKKELLLKHKIAIWDTVKSCEIVGSSDSSIKNVVPADIKWLLEQTKIEKIFANGGKAYQLYQKYAFPITMKEIIKLPSTSPANASYTLERLLEEWKIILEK